jgi:macrolide transport system ATP-binding/permease protein
MIQERVPENAVIEVRGVTRAYSVGDVKVQALRGIDLRIERGEFVAIIGASGSGKSTLMGIIGCLDQPSSGQYIFEGKDVAHLSEPELALIRSERLGFVFQSFNLLARTSALENVALPLIYAENGTANTAERTRRARGALALLGLAERERNTPAQLSGGQQQRVAIARALINSPKLLLADEPTGNLDTKNSHEIMETLVRLNRDRGVTIVVVTHESDIAAYADRIVTMRDGAIVSDERRPLSDAARSARRIAPDIPQDAPTSSARSSSPMAFALMIGTAAVQAIARNKTRSALTMLGVFVGVAALITMVAVGDGANEAVRKQIESLGTNLVVVVPGATTTNGVRGGFGSASTLTVKDAQAIRREDPAVALVAWLTRQMNQTEFGSQNWTTNIEGVSANFPPVTNWRIAIGRPISDEDDRDEALVVVVGQTVARQLFGPAQNPVGTTILVKGVPLRIIGTLSAKGQTPYGQDQDDVVMIPFSTAERKVLGVSSPTQQLAKLNSVYPAPPNPFGLQPHLTGYVNQIYVQAVSSDRVPAAIAEVTQTLLQRHRIRAGEAKDFDIRNLSQIAETAAGSGRIFALLLAAVASISLLVGGIGIMNILLVSVTERTREIGLRMAIGARRLQVLLQFLAEAVLMSLAGGIAGIAIGIAASKIISLITGWQTPISIVAIGIGFTFSAAVGIFFGYYPARKAAHFDPIQALRFE